MMLDEYKQENARHEFDHSPLLHAHPLALAILGHPARKTVIKTPTCPLSPRVCVLSVNSHFFPDAEYAPDAGIRKLDG